MAQLKDTIVDGDLTVTGELTFNDFNGNLEQRNYKITEWGSAPSDEEYPSAKLVKDTIDNLGLEGGSGGVGGGDGGPKKEVIIGLYSYHNEGAYDFSWEYLTTKNELDEYENYINFIIEVTDKRKTIVFLDGTYNVPSDMQLPIEDPMFGKVAFPLIDIKGFNTEIVLNYGATGTFCSGFGAYFNENLVISGLTIDCNNSALAGFNLMSLRSSNIEIRNVTVKNANAIGIGVGASNSVISNCQCIDCGIPASGEDAGGIILSGVYNDVGQKYSVIENCTVKGGSFAGIGILGSSNCKIVNCNAEDVGKIGIGVIGGENNIVVNSTVSRNQPANPQNNEFGLLLSETTKCLVSNNIINDGYIVEDTTTNCLVENNIGNTL